MRGRILSSARCGPWGVLGLALCIRGGVLLLGLSSLQDDPDAYTRLATTWSQTGMFGVESADRSTVTPTAFRPSLYPWLLSWLVLSDSDLPLINIALLHLLLGLATVWLTWSIAKHLRLAWPWLPALLVAVDPLLLRASQLVMTETLAAFLAVLAWRLWLIVYPASCALSDDATVSRQTGEHVKLTSRVVGEACELPRTSGQWLALLALGGVFGLSVLARPTAGPWVALCSLGLLLGARSSWKRRINDCVLVSLLVAVSLTPWVLRNLLVFGKPIWATTHGGYTLLLANNPLLYEHFELDGPSRNWNAEPFHERWGLRYDTGQTASPTDETFWFAGVAPTGDARSVDELSDDRLAYAAARSTIARQPLMFGLSSIYRLGWLWAAWPNTGSALSRLAIGVWYASIFALVIVGVIRGVRANGGGAWLGAWYLPLALVGSLSIVHAVYWSNMRMRAPAMAMLYMAASTTFPCLGRAKPLGFSEKHSPEG